MRFHLGQLCVFMLQVRELDNPGLVYKDCMDIMVSLAEKGLVHCDFNEFNLLASSLLVFLTSLFRIAIENFLTNQHCFNIASTSICRSIELLANYVSLGIARLIFCRSIVTCCKLHSLYSNASEILSFLAKVIPGTYLDMKFTN